jgi:hypothetical protein
VTFGVNITKKAFKQCPRTADLPTISDKNVRYAVAKGGTRRVLTSINVLVARMLGTVVQFAKAKVRTKKDRTSTGVGAEVDLAYLKG